MSGGSVQTLKSSLYNRVDTSQATRLFSQARNLGEGLICPAGAGDIQFDIFGRPASQETLLLNVPECSHYTIYSVPARLEAENLERPYMPICAAGLTVVGDTMGVARDRVPRNLYGFGHRGDFVRHYLGANNRQPPEEPPVPRDNGYYFKNIQPFDFSHDASAQAYRG